MSKICTLTHCSLLRHRKMVQLMSGCLSWLRKECWSAVCKVCKQAAVVGWGLTHRCVRCRVHLCTYIDYPKHITGFPYSLFYLTLYRPCLSCNKTHILSFTQAEDQNLSGVKWQRKQTGRIHSLFEEWHPTPYVKHKHIKLFLMNSLCYQ